MTDNVHPLTGADRVRIMAPTEAEAAEVAETIAAAEPWPDMVPLDAAEPPAPFPTHALPPVLARFVTEQSKATGATPDLVATMVLAAVSTVAGGRWLVNCSWRPAWSSPVNLYVMAIAPPGSMKSNALAVATAPIVAIQQELVAEKGPEVQAELSKRRIDEKRLQQYERAAADGKAKPGSVEQDPAELAADLARHLATTPEPVVPAIFTTDATPEKMEELTEAHGGRFAWLDSEGGPIPHWSGRHTAKAGAVSLDIFLKGWSGDRLQVDRLSRKGVTLEAPALTMGFTTQPVHLRDAMGNVNRGRGLLDRFLYAWPDTPRVDRSQTAPAVDASVAKDYDAALRRLYAVAGMVPNSERRTLTMDPDAEDILRSFSRWEYEAGTDGGELDLDTVRGWSDKVSGQVFRIAGLLALIRDPNTSTVDAGAAIGAVEIGRYFAAHAVRTFQELDLDTEAAAARRCWQAIEDGARRNWSEWPAVVSTREVFEAVRGSQSLGLNTAEGVRAALVRLAEVHHLIRPIAKDTAGKRGKPSERWEVHPDYRPGP